VLLQIGESTPFGGTTGAQIPDSGVRGATESCQDESTMLILPQKMFKEI
jgi:hypothetical protein